VRSGVLVSVHSFAADPTRGIFILVFLIIMIGGALTLYAWRAPLLKSQAGFELSARESFLLFNNILLVGAAATVFAGTMAPLIAQAFGYTLSVGPPWFNVTFPIFMMPLVALLAIGVHANWKRGRLGERQRMLWVTLAVAAVIACLIVYAIYSNGKVLTPVAATVGVWIIITSLVDPLDRWRRKLSFSRSIIGMTIAHIGLGVFVLSLTTVESFTTEHDVSLAQGASTRVGSYAFRFDGVKRIEGPNYEGVGGTITVTRNGAPLTTMYPEKRQYYVQHTTTTESAIEMHYGSNVLVALGEDLGAGKWSIRIQIRPLVNFVWLAAFIMALGGAIAASDRRYRLANAPAAAVAPETTVGERA
jgi:cytochrome c-type biogenesis protein CcmF